MAISESGAGAPDPQLFYPGLKRGSFHAQNFSGTTASRYPPPGFGQNADDMPSLQIFQR